MIICEYDVHFRGQSDADQLTNSSTRLPSGVSKILAVMYSNIAERAMRGTKRTSLGGGLKSLTIREKKSVRGSSLVVMGGPYM